MIPEILFLKQEDTIAAGLLDMKMIMEVTEKAIRYMGEGKTIHPSKMKIGIPDDVDWDSFFNSMPAFLGGDFNIAGFKWAAESKYNVLENNGLPLGIDVVILSDPHTVAPKAIMDGTIITAMRTSAVAGMAAKYLASKNTKTACLVGAGVIGRTMIMAVEEALPGLETIYLADLDLEKAKGVAAEFAGKYNVIPIATAEEGVVKADLVVTETTARKPIIKKAWLKPNATVIQMSGYELEDDVALGADKIYVDNWAQMTHYKGTLIKSLADNHGLKYEDITELKDVVTGKAPGRESDDQQIVCCTLGLGLVDIAVAHTLYQNALKKGIGQKLNFWDNPLWV